MNERIGRAVAFIEAVSPCADTQRVAEPTIRAKTLEARSRAAVSGLLVCFVVGLVAAVGAGSLPSTVHAAASIEAVWSFNGGEVAIQPQPNGRFVGTVVAPTKFAQCSHAVGERMWTDIHRQEDGSYWGFHQWYFESSTCPPNPTLGPTTWRVLKTDGGARTLIVCFSSPGSSQPTITPGDMRQNVTYGCFESALIGPLPGEANALAFKRSVRLPSARRCYSARVFPIHLKDPIHDPLKSVAVRLGAHKLTVLRHGRKFTATINLKGLPRGTFTVHILATTVLGQRLSGHRTYHTCRRKAAKHGSSKSPHARSHGNRR
jgi:hypothetical protein